MSAHKSADHQVVLERPAMRGAKQQPPAPACPALSGLVQSSYRLSYSGAARELSARERRSACPSFRAPDQSARHRPRRRGADRARRGRRPGDRPAVSHARMLPRPQRPADDSRRAKPGIVATLAVEVVRHERPATSRQPWRIIVKDDTGFAELVFFRFTARSPDAARRETAGLRQAGRVQRPADHRPSGTSGAVRPARPDPGDRAGLAADRRAVATARSRAALAQALALLPEFPEWHDPALLKREKWPPFAEALRDRASAVRMPNPQQRMRARLAYDELLAGQVALALIRGRVRARSGQPLIGDFASARRGAAPFRLRADAVAGSRRWRRSTPTWRRPAGCCGCCRAMSAPARRWSRCWRCCAPSRPASRRR